MLIDVVVKKFMKDEHFRKIANIERKYSLCSVDLDDDSFPVEEYSPGEYILTEDIELAFYRIVEEGDADSSVSEALRDMCFYQAEELRDWFKDLTAGLYRLHTRWIEDELELISFARKGNEMIQNTLVDRVKELERRIKHIEDVPYICPVCQGRGVVPNGFYLSNNWSKKLASSSTSPEKCRTCHGNGYLNLVKKEK